MQCINISKIFSFQFKSITSELKTRYENQISDLKKNIDNKKDEIIQLQKKVTNKTINNYIIFKLNYILLFTGI